MTNGKEVAICGISKMAAAELAKLAPILGELEIEARVFPYCPIDGSADAVYVRVVRC